MRQIETALSAGHRRGVVLADATYGGDTAWREQLAGHGLTYAVAVRSSTTVWWGDHQPVPEPEPAPTHRRGRRRCRVQRNAHHKPISVIDLARGLPQRAWRDVSWREGVAGTLSSRFARVRVRAAHRDQPRDEQWLIIEWLEDAREPAHYWFSNLPRGMQWKPMIDTVMGRWRIERDYQELEQELGLGRYEGRNWRGFHHHATLCIAAYGFLLLERLSGSKKTPLDSKRLPYPKVSGRAGLDPMQRHEPNSIATWRFRLGRVVARTLRRCPCCGQARPRENL